ncbi:hypothetical protein M9H77_21212 [Catharanthus roseus]|uniref:Uncharacterized protein n=1 Tax=Catharanthus roseus TaxID=4058 RepID=A0ACC0AP11_CATRO|nr:hypothetical protein M9H77_21212 [Catharanthus roseus]
MESINPVRVQLFWDSEIARDAYGPYFTGTIRKSWTLPMNRIISHSDLVKKILKYRDMDPNLWSVRMMMRVPTYYEAHLANDPEIPISNIIQEVQVLYQTGCTYKRAWYARKFAIERVFGSWDTTFNILPKYLQVVQDINPGTVYEFLHQNKQSP